MTKAMRLAGIIVGIAILVSAIAGTGTYFLVNHINNSKAMTGDAAASIGNILKDGNTVNYDTYQALLTKLGNNTTSVRKASAINGGTPVVFQMGTVGSTPIYWQVVYQTGDYITVWMTNSYTAEYYNRSGSAINNSDLAGGTNGKYDNYANYSQSTLRDVTKAIYTRLSGTSAYPVLSKIVKAPSAVAQVNDWQSTQKNAYYSTSYWSVTNGLGSNANSGSGKSNVNPHNFSWSSCMSDMFWIPSHYEVFNIDTAGSASNTNGFWGLSSANYIKDNNTSTALDGKSTNSYCWLRSGYSNAYDRAVRVYSSGSASNSNVSNSYGVRPAAHISLTELYNASAYRISATTKNSSVDKTLAGYIQNSGVDHAFTFTPNTNYYMDSVTIGATDGTPAQTNIAINDSQPSAYSNITNLCKYKVYREGNTVKVVVNELTEHITIVGSASTTIKISTGSNISNLSLNRDTYLNTTGTVSATFANGYYPQFSYNSSTTVKLSGSVGKGEVGSIGYSYTFTSNVLIITFTNLPTGANNIPTLNLTAYTLDNYDITVNAPNCVYEIIYENTQTIINVTPNTGYYITQAYVDSNAPEDVKFYRGYLVQTGGAFSISYETSANSSKVKFIVKDLSANLTLNIVTGNTKPILEAGGGTKIDGVALQTKLAGNSDTLACVGKATITGYTTTDGLDDVIVYATASAGYKFDHWEIDGAALDTSTYGISAYIPYEMLDGKILVAVFAPNTTNTNDTTNTPDSGGFV